MKIGIIGAMEEEVALYIEAMKEQTTTTKAGITYYSGKLQGSDIVLCKSGVGKVNASVCTQILIDQFQVEQVIFTGVAGAVHPDLEIGDIVVSSDCLQHDIDATPLGFKPGEIPYSDKWIWEADQQLVQLIVSAGKSISGQPADGVNVRVGRVLSGDQFIADRNKVKQLLETFAADCIEMEGAAVAQVCTMNQVPFVIVRSMSDKADGSAHVNFNEFCKLASQRSFSIITKMLENLSPVPEEAAVIVYSTKGCIECEMVKKMLTEQEIAFEVRDVMERQEYRDAVEQFGFLGVPVTVVGQQAVKGFQPEELRQLLAAVK